MNDRKQEAGPSIGDAAWAHNRWPAVGLYTGAGFGLALGVIFWLGWLWTIVLIVGLAFAGCFALKNSLMSHIINSSTDPSDPI